MKIKYEKETHQSLIRLLSDDWIELAYMTIGLSGLEANVEFTSDWHEHKRGWLRFGFGLFKIAISFPWKWTVPDHHQCSGPRYGFQFYSDLLWIYYGKAKGTRNDPIKAIYMPWAWDHKEHLILSELEIHPYSYKLKSGEIQNMTATINVESRRWGRYWIPSTMFRKTINVNFSEEVGEESGSWKGGCIGCSYEMKPGESALETLRRMEKERKF